MPDLQELAAEGASRTVLDAHTTLETVAEPETAAMALLDQMDECGIEQALVSPTQPFVAVSNREGNRLVAEAASASNGRLIPYAVASPWFGHEAIDILAEAADLGAKALKLDPALQGFDLLDDRVEPLLEFAATHRWPVYVRTGTPPHALPLPLAALASRFPQLAFIMGRNGATDFWLDVEPALEYAANLHADTAFTFWDLGLVTLVVSANLGPGRVLFSSDAPVGDLKRELENVLDMPITDADRDAILGGNLARLLRHEGEDR